MKFFTVQPAFKIDVPLPIDELMSRVRGTVSEMGMKRVIGSAGHCIDLKVEPDQRRFWSPHLNVEVSELGEDSQLYCRFSPRPEIWTMFMAIYLVTACIVFASSIYGYVQWFMGQAPWALLLIPIGLLGILVLHVISLVGQGLSSDQMDDLRGRLDEVLAKATEANEPR